MWPTPPAHTTAATPLPPHAALRPKTPATTVLLANALLNSLTLPEAATEAMVKVLVERMRKRGRGEAEGAEEVATAGCCCVACIFSEL